MSFDSLQQAFSVPNLPIFSPAPRSFSSAPVSSQTTQNGIQLNNGSGHPTGSKEAAMRVKHRTGEHTLSDACIRKMIENAGIKRIPTDLIVAMRDYINELMPFLLQESLRECQRDYNCQEKTTTFLQINPNHVYRVMDRLHIYADRSSLSLDF